MTTLTEGRHANESFVSEANGDRSREAVIVKSGQNLSACAVLATLVTATVVSAAKSGGNTGNGTFVVDPTTPALLNVTPGAYSIRFTSTTSVRLEDTFGNVLGDTAIVSTTGQTATIAEQIKGLLTQGSVVFVAGDGFDVTVSAIAEKEVEYNPAGTDGSQRATGILYGEANATAADVRAVAYKRECEHNGNVIVWKAGITTVQKEKGVADLKRRGIIIRN